MVAVEQNPAITQVVGIIKELSANERERQIAESREKYRREMADAALSGELRGRQEMLTLVYTVRNRLACGESPETIAEETGLSVKQVLDLK